MLDGAPKSVFIVGFAVLMSLWATGCTCVGSAECPRGYEEVQECPENASCKEVHGCEDTSVLCKKLTCETDPYCPNGSDDVEECLTDERCFLRERCGDAVMCREDNPRVCDHRPECPDRSQRVTTCPKDALCFPVRRCGTEITCEDLTAD